MMRVLSVVAALAVGATAVYAQSAAIGQRKEILKTFGGAMKEPGGIAKGETPFDLAKVQASLKTISEGAPKLGGLFPDDSKTGGETQALPVIWEKKAEFEGLFKKLETDAKAAAVAIKDEATFKAEWPKIGANCGNCHKSLPSAAQDLGRQCRSCAIGRPLAKAATCARGTFPRAFSIGRWCCS